MRRSGAGGVIAGTVGTVADADQPLRDLLRGSFAYAAQRTMRRLDGLTDEEYFWEPAPGCWTVRRVGGGIVTDGSWPPPDPPPVTTIGWRLVHVCSFLRDHWLRPVAFGVEPAPERPVPETAAAALIAVAGAIAAWQHDLDGVDDERLWAPMGPAAAPYSEGTVASFVEHIHDEFIHHAAEVALLRDLYRAGATVNRS